MTPSLRGPSRKDSNGSSPAVFRKPPLPGECLRRTGFWHETYFMRGGMEAVYDDLNRTLGFQAFAPSVPARGSMFSARRRLRRCGETPAQPEGVAEADIC